MTKNLTPEQALQQYFGFAHFREGQQQAIEHILNGQHTLLVMPTGSGKSLTYQLPALLFPGLTLVISPLIALMKDQVDSLVERDIPATYINSTLPKQEIDRRLRAVSEGHVKLLYVAPERLRSRNFTRILAKLKVSLLAVDEAHCISQWGHDFRPDYLQTGPTWQAMGRPTLLATTATATTTVQADIVKLLGAAQCQTIVTGFNRPNLTFQVKSAPDARTKLQHLQALLKPLAGSAIVYAGTRRNADEVADFIQDVVGLPTGAYHAGLDRQRRHQVQSDFMADRLKVVVATNAFGMGVDKANVRTVVHYNMPATVEAYYQEAGRAGRDGLPAECVMLFSPDDMRLQEWMINSDTPTYDDLHQVYHRLGQAANEGDVYFATYELAEMTGLHETKIRVILNELELAGAIMHLGDQGSYSHWKVLTPERESIQARSRAIQARAKIRRDLLDNMVDYAQLDGCRREFLLRYFGDTSSPTAPRCCDNHTQQNIADLPKAVTPQDWFPLIVLETVRSLEHRPVGRNRLAQLLNGSRAKAIQQFGYDRHKFYGKLQGLSQSQISDLIAALIDAKFLHIRGGELPVLVLSPLGGQALEARAAIPIQVAGLVFEPDQVDRWQNSPDRSDTVTQTLALLQQGLTLSEIAAQRGLAESTIYTHFARLIAAEKVALHQIVSPEVETQVVAAIAKVGNSQFLSRLKAMLPAISYGEIKCVIAAYPDPESKAAPAPMLEPASPEALPLDTAAPSPHPAPDAVSPSQASPTIIILEAVAKLGGTLGRTGLAQFLSGSKVAWLETFVEHSAYGQLSHLSQQAILNIIDALLTDGKLVSTGGRRPKVRLPEQNLSQAAGSSPISDSPSDNSPEIVPELMAEAALVSTLEELEPSPESPAIPPTVTQPNPDPTLLEALKSWRTEQARIQKKPPYIIFSNKVLTAIAAQQPATLTALGEISGIGPAKLDQYGEDVLALVAETLARPMSSAQPQISTEPREDPSTSDLHIKEESPPIQNLKPKIQSPQTIIINVVSDLDGLLSLDGLVALLTAAPGEVVSFSDHQSFGQFHAVLTAAELEAHIQEAIQEGKLALSPYQRLGLP